MPLKLLPAIGAVTLIGFAALITNPAQAANDKNKHKITFQVLENSTLDDCLYAGDVVLDARYKLHQADSGQLTVEQSSDGQTYTTVLTQALDGRKGNTILTFNAGECTKDIRINIESF